MDSENQLELRGRASEFYLTCGPELRSSLDEHLDSIRSDPLPDPDGERIIRFARPPIVQYVYQGDGWIITFTLSRSGGVYRITVTGIMNTG